MKIRLIIEEVQVPGTEISFDLTPEQASSIAIVPLLGNIHKFLTHHQALLNKRLFKEHPFFEKFSADKQTEILKEFRAKLTLDMIDGPLEQPKADMKIIT